MGQLSIRKIFSYLSIAVLAFIGLRFLLKAVSHFFVFTPESYTPYFWPRSYWLLMHLIFGMTAFIIGPFQFVPYIRNNYLKTHRFMGKTYLLCICVAAPAGFYLSLTSQVNTVYASGLFSLATVWVTTSLMAYIAIRRRKISLHREWMVRSYVTTFAFATFRLFDELLGKLTTLPDPDRLALLSWAAWALPLFVTEVVIQGKKIFRKELVVE